MFEAHKDPEGNVYITFNGDRIDLLTAATDVCNTLNWVRDQQAQLRKQANDIGAVLGKLSG